MSHEPPLAFPVPDVTAKELMQPVNPTVRSAKEPRTFFFYRGDGTSETGAEFVFKGLLPELAGAGSIEDEALRLFEALRESVPGSVFEALCKIAAKEITLVPRAVPGIVEAVGHTHHAGMVSSERILEGELVTVELQDGSKVRMLLKPAVFRRWDVSEEMMRRAQLMLRQGSNVAQFLDDQLTYWDTQLRAQIAKGPAAVFNWVIAKLKGHGLYETGQALTDAVAALIRGDDQLEVEAEIDF